MAAYTVQTPTKNGSAALTATAVAASDTFANDGATLLIVRNHHASTSTTVAIAPAVSSADVSGYGTMTAPSLSIAVAAGTSAVLGPLNPSLYNTNGSATVTYTSTATVFATAVTCSGF